LRHYQQDQTYPHFGKTLHLYVFFDKKEDRAKNRETSATKCHKLDGWPYQVVKLMFFETHF
jgi:hypothetical protein